MLSAHQLDAVSTAFACPHAGSQCRLLKTFFAEVCEKNPFRWQQPGGDARQKGGFAGCSGNRDRGPPAMEGAPATPPGMRVRTRRLEWLRISVGLPPPTAWPGFAELGSATLVLSLPHCCGLHPRQLHVHFIGFSVWHLIDARRTSHHSLEQSHLAHSVSGAVSCSRTRARNRAPTPPSMTR